jgi:hypothetical protein
LCWDHGDRCQFDNVTLVRLELSATQQHAIRVDGHNEATPIKTRRIDVHLPDEAPDSRKVSCGRRAQDNPWHALPH